MTSIKLQAYTADDVPPVDQRGAEPTYPHKTLAESDPAEIELVQAVLEDGDWVNDMLAQLIPAIPGIGHLKLGVFVMDGDGRE